MSKSLGPEQNSPTFSHYNFDQNPYQFVDFFCLGRQTAVITSPKPIRVIPRGKPIKKIIVFRLNREAPPKGAGKAPQGKNVYDHGLVFF